MDLRSFVVVLRSLRRRFADQGAPWTYVIARPSWPGVSWTRLRFVDNPLSKLNINRVSESARLPVFRGVSQSEIAHVIQSLIFPSILTFSEILFHSPLTTHLHLPTMASSRIFINGLPPSITEAEFKKHFSQQHPITDAKLIAHRRIGYVGYKSPEDAENAVKYFNKSFIRMSKIGVEIARPVRSLSSSFSGKSLTYLQIKDETLPKSRKQQREDATHVRKEELAAATAASSSNKRKREEAEEMDPKLKEYLSVMQAPSKIKTWAVESLTNASEEPPAKIQAIEAPGSGAESDDEYVAVPKKAKRKEASSKSVLPPEADAAAVPVQAPALVDSSNPNEEVSNPRNIVSQGLVDGDDWLRSKTSRLLDLMDPEEIKAQTAKSAPADDDNAMDIDQISVDNGAADEPASVEETPRIAPEEEATQEEDPTLDAIRANGRLFVRNLPYSASEDDLREHFAKYGSIEEVMFPAPF